MPSFSKLNSAPGPKDLLVLLQCLLKDDERACKAIAEYIATHPPSENDPVLLCDYHYEADHKSMVAGLGNAKPLIQQGMTANTATDICGLGVAFHFVSARAMYDAHVVMQTTHSWAYYSGRLAAQRAGLPQAEPATIDTGCITGLVGGGQRDRQVVHTDTYRFFEL